jgi:predicted tellurium resistance membrane protein TerC
MPLFLLYKSVNEIHHKLEGEEESEKGKAGNTLTAAIVQIAVLNLVFSFDSILTAVGLTPHVMVMIFAVILAMGVMMAFSGPISDIINRYPTLQMLALSFLIMIGLTLILEGMNVHVNKSVVYIAILFSLGVELLNIRLRKKADIK